MEYAWAPIAHLMALELFVEGSSLDRLSGEPVIEGHCAQMSMLF